MHHPSSRVELHAKTITHDGRQVLAYLYRDSTDALCVALQMWVAASDEQLRAVVQVETDEEAILWFSQLDETTIAAALDGTGLAATLAQIEQALA